jgi:signal transduction histidine kinase
VVRPTHQPRRPRGEAALERTLFVGITAFRWTAWVLMAVTVTIDVQNSEPGTPEAVAHPGVGFALVVLALAYTVWATTAVRRDAAKLDRGLALGVDMGIATLLVFLDPWVYQSPHTQHLGNNWAIASVLSAGVMLAGRGGFVAGFIIGTARAAGLLLWQPGRWHGDDTVSALAGIFIYSVGGAVAGFFAIKLREAEREISAARARDEVARTLHDGVLQTLAVIQRRSTDPDLTRLAREQERELRLFLFGDKGPDDLATSLRAAAAKFERVHGGRVEVVIGGDLPRVKRETTQALTGAVTEALTNAAKHGGASRVVVYVEPTDDDGLFCSVKDDGAGFDPETVPAGVGLDQSIRARLAEIGGHAEVVSRPGRGTEVRLDVPLR